MPLCICLGVVSKHYCVFASVCTFVCRCASSSAHVDLEITVPIGWALNTNN